MLERSSEVNFRAGYYSLTGTHPATRGKVMAWAGNKLTAGGCWEVVCTKCDEKDGEEYEVQTVDGSTVIACPPSEADAHAIGAVSALADALAGLCRAWYKAGLPDDHPAVVAAESALAKAEGKS